MRSIRMTREELQNYEVKSKISNLADEEEIEGWECPFN